MSDALWEADALELAVAVDDGDDDSLGLPVTVGLCDCEAVREPELVGLGL